jgi:hypothetical protein
MRQTLRTMALASLLVLGGLAITAASVQAGGCGGGGGGGYGGGHTFGASYGGSYGGGASCCTMGGMGMSGMAMAGMPVMSMGSNGGYMSYPQPYYPQNGGYAPPAAYANGAAAAPAQYYCPMHPSVVTAGPGTCPICHMALVRR